HGLQPLRRDQGRPGAGSYAGGVDEPAANRLCWYDDEGVRLRVAAAPVHVDDHEHAERTGVRADDSAERALPVDEHVVAADDDVARGAACGESDDVAGADRSGRWSAGRAHARTVIPKDEQ